MDKTKNNIEEKRSYPRLKRLYLISYINKEGDRQISPVSMGRTIDISQAGARLEVFQQIQPESHVEMEIAIDESILSVQGKVVHSKETDDKVYVIGIQFNELQAELVKRASPEE